MAEEQGLSEPNKDMICCPNCCREIPEKTQEAIAQKYYEDGYFGDDEKSTPDEPSVDWRDLD